VARLFVNAGVRAGARFHAEPDWSALVRELKRPGVNLLVLSRYSYAVAQRRFGAGSLMRPGYVSSGCPFCLAGRRASFWGRNRAQRVWRSISPRGRSPSSRIRRREGPFSSGGRR
jgi:hypothetical protein